MSSELRWELQTNRWEGIGWACPQIQCLSCQQYSYSKSWCPSVAGHAIVRRDLSGLRCINQRLELFKNTEMWKLYLFLLRTNCPHLLTTLQSGQLDDMLRQKHFRTTKTNIRSQTNARESFNQRNIRLCRTGLSGEPKSTVYDCLPQHQALLPKQLDKQARRMRDSILFDHWLLRDIMLDIDRSILGTHILSAVFL